MRRALRLHETAEIVTEKYAGDLPSTRDELLALRRELPSLFATGSYQPLAVEGLHADRVLAFMRRQGAERVDLSTGEWRQDAHLFYEQLGFDLHSRGLVKRLSDV